MKKRTAIICAAGLVFFLALGITLYPLFASRYSERHQSKIHTQYQQEVAKSDDTAITEARENAIRYNAALASGVLEEDAFSGDALQQAQVDYADLLNLTGSGIMGYVQIPKLNVTLPIYHGTADSTLEIGVGHLLGSSLPVGGESTHTILTGHSGMASQKMFSDLPELEVGDVFFLEVLNETLAYQVDQIKTVLPHDTTYLGISSGEDYCTLVTCTPFGVNTHRLLVRGSRIPYSEEEKTEAEAMYQEQPASTWEQQYQRGILLGLGLTAFMAAAAIAFVLIRKHWKGKGGKYER